MNDEKESVPTTRYEVMRRDKCDELILAVNSYLNTGWQLQGGVTNALYDGQMVWAQALVKRS